MLTPRSTPLGRASVALLLAATIQAPHVFAASAGDPPPFTVVSNDEWKPADQGNAEVIKGSALDLSVVFPIPREAGSNGFPMLNQKGELAFSKKPDEPVRFRCATKLPIREGAPTSALLSQPDCDRLADQLVRGGYNAVRPHFLDTMLMTGSKQDLQVNPERLSRWDYFAAALKKRGIYLYIDAASSWAAYYAEPNPWSDEAKAKRLFVRMYYDEPVRAHWKEGVKRLFDHVNPYTGVALKNEPQVIVVQARNEAGLAFNLQSPTNVTPEIVSVFRAWLKKQYGTNEKLDQAWRKNGGGSKVSASPLSFETAPWPPIYGGGPDSSDLARFFVEKEREMVDWEVKVLREIGLKVPIIDYNNCYSLQTSLARDGLQIVDNHSYHDHPTDFISPGSTEKGDSSIASGVTFFQWIAATRQLGRPFFCTEWGHVFWNPWRHEAGLTFPSYASLQGWQLLTQFSEPVALATTSIRPFNIFSDPPLRAAEFMSALLYRRGDVQASPHRIEVLLNPASLAEKNLLQFAMRGKISQLSLLAGFGVRVTDWPGAARRGIYHVDLSTAPDKGDNVISRPGVQESKTSHAPESKANASISELRTMGVLGKGNRTDFDQGIYESDTEQILLEEKKNQIRVVTPLSCGASLPECSSEVKLGPVDVRNLGANTTFFLGSLTSDAIPQSHRLLLIVSTNALNTGMSFEDDKKLKLVSLGTTPVLMQVAKVQFTLKHLLAGKLKMWALSANGQRREEIPLTVSNGTVIGLINTALLANGPTPYFELQAPPL